MRKCILTEHLGRFRDRGSDLAQHVGRCDACRVMWKTIKAMTPSSEVDEPCPEPELFADLGEGILNQDKVSYILEHARRCWWCHRTLTEIASDSSGLPDFDSLLEEADHQMATCHLAKEIADWLASEKYPIESARIQASFDDTYGLFEEDPTETECVAPSMSLFFSAEEPPDIAGIIVVLAIIAARAMFASRDLEEALSKLTEIAQRLGIEDEKIRSAHEALKAAQEKRHEG